MCTPSADEVPQPGVYERMARQIYELIVATQPPCLFDLHNAAIDSVPFTIRDRALFHGETQRASEHLAGRLEALARAVGLSAVSEAEPAKYVARKLHRSVAGSIVNTAGIPGQPLDGGEIRAPADGWLVGWSNGMARYRGQTVASLAVRDEDPLICPYPE